jgi:transcriptional regulator with XRE-family HTH domain
MSDLSQGRVHAINRIRLALIEKKMTQAELADAADCHEKTIQNMLAGRTVRDQTLFDACMVLGLNFDELKRCWNDESIEDQLPFREEVVGRKTLTSTNDVSPVYMGAYTRAAVDHFIGHYLTIRPAFTMPNTIIAYRTDISWDSDWPSLLFEERNRPDAPYSHRGRLHVPPTSSFIHLVSLTKGAMRMVILSQMDQTNIMRGLITTLAKNAAVVAPVSAPIIYEKLKDPDGVQFGQIGVDDDAYAPYRARLRQSIDEGYCSIIAP